MSSITPTSFTFPSQQFLVEYLTWHSSRAVTADHRFESAVPNSIEKIACCFQFKSIKITELKMHAKQALEASLEAPEEVELEKQVEQLYNQTQNLAKQVEQLRNQAKEWNTQRVQEEAVLLQKQKLDLLAAAYARALYDLTQTAK
jgi:uncharacterized protein YlxW (UPF0749 family)